MNGNLLGSQIANRILFDYSCMEHEELLQLSARLPRKLVRWLAIHHPDNRTRVTLFRQTGVEIGEGTVINEGVLLFDEYKSLVCFGARVAVATGVVFIASSNPNNSQLASNPFVQKQHIVEAPISVQDDAWIGVNAVIMPGTTIGPRAIVGAGAVVTHDVPADTTVAGVPAQMVRNHAVTTES